MSHYDEQNDYTTLNGFLLGDKRTPKSRCLKVVGVKLYFMTTKGQDWLLAEWVERVLVIRRRCPKVNNHGSSMSDFAAALHHVALDTPVFDKILLVDRDIDDGVRAEARLISHTRGL